VRHIDARYLHLESAAIPSYNPATGVGASVTSTTLIGYTGNTGTNTAHLHYDINDFGSSGGMTSSHKNPRLFFPTGTFN